MRYPNWLFVALAYLLGYVQFSVAADAEFSGPTAVTYVVGNTYGPFDVNGGYSGANTALYGLSWDDGAQVSPITTTGNIPQGLLFTVAPIPLPINSTDLALVGTPAAGTEGTYDITLNATVNNTLYTYAITVVIDAASSFAIQPGISGAWYDPQLSGQGFNIEVLANNTMAAFFYTFDPLGNNVFFSGVGTIGSPDPSFATIPLNATSGGFFPPNFDPSKITRASWGTLFLHFTDCNNGVASWTVDGGQVPGYTDGSIPITRITSIATLPCN